MLFKEIIFVHSKSRTKPINRKNKDLLTAKTGDTRTSLSALKV